MHLAITLTWYRTQVVVVFSVIDFVLITNQLFEAFRWKFYKRNIKCLLHNHTCSEAQGMNQRRKLRFLFMMKIFVEPKIYTINVCRNKYSESSPRILGVKIRLLVIVWKITDENAMAPPVKIIAATFSILRGSVYCQ